MAVSQILVHYFLFQQIQAKSAIYKLDRGLLSIIVSKSVHEQFEAQTGFNSFFLQTLVQINSTSSFKQVNVFLRFQTAH